MAIRVALHHRTIYNYDRLVELSPQVVRLRPAPHCRTPILSYSLKVEPADHFINWQQDPHANFLARLVFAKETRRLMFEVSLVAEMTVINPFDFFLEPYAETYPFRYESSDERALRAFLEVPESGPFEKRLLGSIDRSEKRTIDFLVAINARLQRQIRYMIRMEPGIQTPEQTLSLASGSCRDSAWLLVQLLRHLGLAARFVSGY
jgi:transglutaminase-like putative cysteine protease